MPLQFQTFCHRKSIHCVSGGPIWHKLYMNSVSTNDLNQKALYADQCSQAVYHYGVRVLACLCFCHFLENYSVILLMLCFARRSNFCVCLMLLMPEYDTATLVLAIQQLPHTYTGTLNKCSNGRIGRSAGLGKWE